MTYDPATLEAAAEAISEWTGGSAQEAAAFIRALASTPVEPAIQGVGGRIEILPEDPTMQRAMKAYSIWRGSWRDAGAPPHWVDLTNREREGFAAVVALASPSSKDKEAASPVQGVAKEVVDGLYAQIPATETFPVPEKTREAHLRWMLREIESGAVKGDKAHRWIGFVQGVLAARGHLDIDAERERTRPYLTATPQSPSTVDERVKK